MAVALSFEVVAVDKPDDANVIIGQAHFIKTVEDLHEALVGVDGQLRFGVAFCEASGALGPSQRQRRASGLGTVSSWYCAKVFRSVCSTRSSQCPRSATSSVPANPVEVIVATTAQGSGIVGVLMGRDRLV